MLGQELAGAGRVGHVVGVLTGGAQPRRSDVGAPPIEVRNLVAQYSGAPARIDEQRGADAQWAVSLHRAGHCPDPPVAQLHPEVTNVVDHPGAM